MEEDVEEVGTPKRKKAKIRRPTRTAKNVTTTRLTTIKAKTPRVVEVVVQVGIVEIDVGTTKTKAVERMTQNSRIKKSSLHR